MSSFSSSAKKQIKNNATLMRFLSKSTHSTVCSTTFFKIIANLMHPSTIRFAIFGQRIFLAVCQKYYPFMGYKQCMHACVFSIVLLMAFIWNLMKVDRPFARCDSMEIQFFFFSKFYHIHLNGIAAVVPPSPPPLLLLLSTSSPHEQK